MCVLSVEDTCAICAKMDLFRWSRLIECGIDERWKVSFCVSIRLRLNRKQNNCTCIETVCNIVGGETQESSHKNRQSKIRNKWWCKCRRNLCGVTRLPFFISLSLSRFDRFERRRHQQQKVSDCLLLLLLWTCAQEYRQFCYQSIVWRRITCVLLLWFFAVILCGYVLEICFFIVNTVRLFFLSFRRRCCLFVDVVVCCVCVFFTLIGWFVANVRIILINVNWTRLIFL